ncbi:TIM barrel protein [Aquibacillus halophilus]|uniref:TIM barrel protein n=1 Tax=Aquibacillus halophilus TaxID=930132 RepID=A0A6A8DAL0_9BACI|nr:TIM barrel protein [Aquibacillus halophilus]MRH41596.1 TIM barrel protein [Aquibacillus halophilus]
MRLGGPVKAQDPDGWVKEIIELGYTAGTIPKNVGIKDTELQDAFVKAAHVEDIIIAEVGAWSNPISPNEEERIKALEYCKEQLTIADRMRAQCCVNISGSKGPKWTSPHPDNMSEDTFTLIVDTVREIIDSVKPKETFFTLEPMPWIFPYDINTYLRLIKAIDRERFGVHLDPVNMITSLEKYYNNSEFLKDCFKKLGLYIKSVHAKDIILQDMLTFHLDEVRPGKGTLNYGVFLVEMNKLPKDTSFLLEHLPNEEEYKLGADFVRSIAKKKGITL